jgi:dihydroorotate dehydrogenase (NAD+) catalytic subunit
VSRSRPHIEVFGTTFQNPVLLAAGTAGFGCELARVIQLDRLGGVTTKAVSPESRAGHAAPRVAEFPGGMLNAVGLANPGMDSVAGGQIPWLASNLKRARVIVNVVGSVMNDYVAVVRRLEGGAGITAFELNVSCPNTARGGEEFGADEGILAELVSACRSATTKPLIVKLSPTLPDPARTAAAAARAGAAGFSLVNTLPGALFRFGAAGTSASRLGYGQGGVSGPALLPVGVLATRRVRERTGLPVIGVGGIRRMEDARQYFEAGASLVAIGTAALADPRIPERIAAAWEAGG